MDVGPAPGPLRQAAGMGFIACLGGQPLLSGLWGSCRQGLCSQAHYWARGIFLGEPSHLGSVSSSLLKAGGGRGAGNWGWRRDLVIE